MNRLKSAWARLGAHEVLRSVTVLAGGSALAQLITLIVSPLLTRLYSPADFGILAVFLAVVSAIAPAVCGRYEVATVLPKSDAHGRLLLGISLLVAFASSTVCLLVIAAFRIPFLDLLGARRLGAWIFLVPVGLFLTGITTAFAYYANRMKEYGLISKCALTQSATVAAVSIGLGFAEFGFGSLIVGNIAGLGAAAGVYVFRYRSALSSRVLVWDRRKFLLLRRYRDFPIYNASTGLLNGIARALPIMFLSRYFSEGVVGQYSLMLRVVGAPFSLVSSAASQVHLKRVSTLVIERKLVTPYLVKMALALLGVSLLPATALALVAPWLFGVLFGERWSEAGQYAQILMPALVVQFVVSTLSSGTLAPTHNNRVGALWKVGATLVTVGVLAWFAPRVAIEHLMKVLMATDVFLYALFFLVIWRAASKPRAYV